MIELKDKIFIAGHQGMIGSAIRKCLHVNDLGNACVHVMEKLKPKGEEIDYLNVGTGIETSIKSLAETIASLIEYEGTIQWDESKPDGITKKQLDITRIKSIGWKPSISLESGLFSTIEDYKLSN